MADNIQTMIPRYGELNRIYRDYIDNSTFSFDRQKKNMNAARLNMTGKKPD